MFDFVDGLLYKFDTTSLNCGESYSDSLNWIKNKGATINPKSNDNRHCQYAVTIVLNHEIIGYIQKE